MSDNTRRESDAHQQREIENLIASEQDSKVRLQLIVMNKMALSIVANTAAQDLTNESIALIGVKLERHLERFEIHTKAAEAIYNKNIGAQRVWSRVLGVAQAGIIGLVGYGISYMQDIRADVVIVRTEQIRRAPYIKTLEDYVTHLNKRAIETDR